MVLSPDSRQAAHPEQEAVVLAGSSCEEGGAGGRTEWPQRLGLSYSQGTMGQHCTTHTPAVTACRSKVPGVAEGLPMRAWLRCGISEVAQRGHFLGNRLALGLCNS